MERISEYVNFNDFPSELLKQIPLSLRVNNQTFLFKDLPIEIQYLIEKYYEEKVPEIEYVDFLDAKFEISPYSDLKIISDKKDLISTYLKNYLNTRIGSFPFDVDFGCALKDQLQTKDTSFRQTLIANELYLISSVIGGDYDTKVSISNFTIESFQDYDKVEYYAKISVQVNDENTEIIA